jgi:pimeloyl-[acyl-carrier protein] methyl ester esterase
MMRKMTISNRTVDLYYECHGNGPDVLLIHGWASSGRMWHRLIRDLSHSLRFWSIDLAGFGASVLSPDALGLGIDEHAATLIDFCQQKAIHPKVVMGHSMGGMIALRMAHQHPHFMRALVLVCPVVTGRFAFNTHQLVNTDLGRFVMANSKMFWEVAQSEMFKQIVPMLLYAEKESERIYNDFKRMSWQGAVMALDGMTRMNLAPHLDKIKHPSLVIVGGNDFTVSPDEGRLAASMMPHGKLIEFASSHHQPLDEEPERFIETVRHYLRQHRILAAHHSS